MPCDLTVWDPESKVKTTLVCDEENAGRIVTDEHAAKSTGEYLDTSGNKHRFDWTRCRLVRFDRRV